MSDAHEGEKPPAILPVVFFGSVALLIIVEVLSISLYCISLPAGRMSAFAGAFMLGAASMLAGAFIGFLFGLPRALINEDSSVQPADEHELRTNTNLEQVSDWLTKILVGVTLVQLANVSAGFGKFVKIASAVFGPSTKSNEVMTGAVIVYSVVFGFFGAYIAARTIVKLAFQWPRSRRT